MGGSSLWNLQFFRSEVFLSISVVSFQLFTYTHPSLFKAVLYSKTLLQDFLGKEISKEIVVIQSVGFYCI